MQRWFLDLVALLFAESVRADERSDFFESKIRPVLAEHCYRCHSADAKKAGKLKAQLSLDTKAGLLKGGDTGPAIVANKPGESLLLKAMMHEGDLQMPPSGKLPAGVLADFKTWIERGGFDPRDQIRLRADPVEQPDPFQALDHQTHAPVGDPGELVDHPHGAHAVQILGRGLCLGLALRHQGQEPVAAHDLVDEPERARLAHGQRDRRHREHHHIRKRQDRERVRNLEVTRTTRLDRHQRALARFGKVMWSRPLS